ncbi:unnamed protein product, partial [Staurois parvus]
INGLPAPCFARSLGARSTAIRCPLCPRSRCKVVSKMSSLLTTCEICE